jgi:hypothetical protein
VLLYEDFATGKWARRVCRFLDAQAGAGGFEQGLWRCESLEGRQVQSRVAGAVARADMVIFSVYSDLPAGTGALLGAWLEGKRWHDSALMAMVVDGAGVPATQADRSVITRLAHLARDHGLKFVRERLEIQDGPRQGTWELAWVF